MPTIVLVILAVVVALVSIDAIARLDERGRRRGPPRGERASSKPTISVDLSKRP